MYKYFLKDDKAECTCGNTLSFRPTPFQTPIKMACPVCKKIYYHDEYPITWDMLRPRKKEATI